jgi:hypothetical protein
MQMDVEDDGETQAEDKMRLLKQLQQDVHDQQLSMES